MIGPDGRVGLLYQAEEREAPVPGGGTSAVEEAWRELLPVADVLFDLHPAAIPALERSDHRLAFIQAIGAGAGELLADARIARAGVTICTARGVHDGPLADFALAAILGHAKRFRDLAEFTRRHMWEETEAQRVDETSMVVVGLGSIGTAVARRARAFGIAVHGVQRRPRPSADVDSVHPLDDLDDLLPGADWIVNALPGGPETSGLFDAGRFARCMPGAYFVNVGRGTTVDEPALVAALESGRLGGAALDVTAEEPLPSASPLWDAPGVTISAHCAALVPGAMDRMVDILIENLTRLHEGRPLINVASVDGHRPAER
ncbi:MAG: D-2-hydroxyacid dehydrogenase [Microbacteriaceae bacterium]|nr:D-2-hydroxyacid dehydrogenase [Microbacteriaceae bacterium]